MSFHVTRYWLLHKMHMFTFLSRGHATLHLAMLVGPSHFLFLSGFRVTAPAQPLLLLLLFAIRQKSSKMSSMNRSKDESMVVGDEDGVVSSIDMICESNSSWNWTGSKPEEEEEEEAGDPGGG